MLEICFHTNMYRTLKESSEKNTNIADEILCLPYALDEGDISDLGNINIRKDIYQYTWGNDWKDMINHFTEKKLEKIKKHNKFRIWFSSNASEYCGLLYSIAMIKDYIEEVSIVYCASYSFEDTEISFASTGEISPEDLPYLLKNETQLTPTQADTYASHWRQLQKENAPIRVTSGDDIKSISDESYYDSIIYHNLPDIHTAACWLAAYIVQQQHKAPISRPILEKRIERLIKARKLKLF